mgnify:CR=1 FL=1
MSLAGCTGATASDGADISVGSYESDAIPRASMRAMMDDFPGGEVDINVLDHETFKASINNYLQGNPNDVFTWFAGYRARYFGERGLIAPLDDIDDAQLYARLLGEFPEWLRAAKTAGFVR